MKALIFAAGRGSRLRPLTDRIPKPLVTVGGDPLIVWHLRKLAQLDIRSVVINVSWLSHVFHPTLGDGSAFGVNITYVDEGQTPLETGGGLLNALGVLGREPFLLINGDIWTDYAFTQLPAKPRQLAHLVLVPPSPAVRGDFALTSQGRLDVEGANKYIYAGIGVYDPAILTDWQNLLDSPVTVAANGKPIFGLAPILRAHSRRGLIDGELYHGKWVDAGTADQLANLRQQLSS